MSSILWFLFRVALIAWFFAGGLNMARAMPELPTSFPLAAMVCIVVLFPAWRFYSILAAQKREMRESHDWRASLWFSPILKNPQSWVLTSGSALTACGIAIVGACISSGRSVFVGMFFVSFGIGVLLGLIVFRIRNEKKA